LGLLQLQSPNDGSTKFDLETEGEYEIGLSSKKNLRNKERRSTLLEKKHRRESQNELGIFFV